MKYNILHLTPDFNYADGRSYYVYLLSKYLKRRGHNVYLMTNSGDSFDRINEDGIPVIVNKSLSKKSSFLKCLKFIDETVTEYDIQIIHSYHRYYELLAASLPVNKKVHTVSTALSIVNNRYFVEYKSERIIAVSNSVKRMLIENFNVKEEKISLIPNFVDTEELSTDINRTVRNENGINLLAIGRFHKEKNFETLLRAMILLKSYDLKLALVGEGEEKFNYEKIIKENSLNVKIYPPRRNLREFFEAADICILTSVRDPFPGFMLQSGLFRKPFIGSDADGISELIINKKNGLLFEKKNVQDLAEKIKYFIEDRKTADECAYELNRIVLSKYTEKTVIQEIEEVYDNLFDKLKT